MTKYIRYRTASAQPNGGQAYGILDGETVREISGGLFGEHSPTGSMYSLSQVKLLYPCQPTKILCVGLNYKSHLAGRPQPTHPEIFYKPLSALQDPGGPIVTPATRPICITKANWSPLLESRRATRRPRKPAKRFSA